MLSHFVLGSGYSVLMARDEQLRHSLWDDKGYADAGQQQRYEESGVTWRVSRKARRNKKLNIADRSFNRKSNRVRARVEHAFGIVRHLWGYRKVRYKGIAKNAGQIFSLLA